jgi:hypothetical protein
VRQGQRPSCEGSTIPFRLTVCTLKDALMLLLKGATYLETPKHASVVKVQAIWKPDGRLLVASHKEHLMSRPARAIHPPILSRGLSGLFL